jgi:hypothetical protein
VLARNWGQAIVGKRGVRGGGEGFVRPSLGKMQDAA